MYTISLKEVKNQDVSIAGGKGANLGELISIGCNVPEGFVITTQVYDAVMKRNRISTLIDQILRSNENDENGLELIYKQILSSKIQEVLEEQLPQALAEANIEPLEPVKEESMPIPVPEEIPKRNR